MDQETYYDWNSSKHEMDYSETCLQNHPTNKNLTVELSLNKVHGRSLAIYMNVSVAAQFGIVYGRTRDERDARVSLAFSFEVPVRFFRLSRRCRFFLPSSTDISIQLVICNYMINGQTARQEIIILKLNPMMLSLLPRVLKLT